MPQDFAALPASTLAAIKADASFAKLLATILGKFMYNATTGVLTLYQDDGVTVIGTVTISQLNGIITSRL